jgi:hypothetical protein
MSCKIKYCEAEFTLGIYMYFSIYIFKDIFFLNDLVPRLAFFGEEI